jgi:hypothetical protein
MSISEKTFKSKHSCRNEFYVPELPLYLNVPERNLEQPNPSIK